MIWLFVLFYSSPVLYVILRELFITREADRVQAIQHAKMVGWYEQAYSIQRDQYKRMFDD